MTVLTIDRPDVRNALDVDALHALGVALREAAADGTAATVVTGAGDVSFSSGMDLRALALTEPGLVSEAMSAFNRAMEDPARPPLIAAVNGAAVGGGFEMVLRCDLVIAADHATFRLPEVSRGMVPGGGATLLPGRLPIAVAMEVVLMGTELTATRAAELGLVNRVVRGGVLDQAVAWGEQLARCGPRAVALSRTLLWSTALHGAAKGWSDTKAVLGDAELRLQAREGASAFLEKREPAWRAI